MAVGGVGGGAPIDLQLDQIKSADPGIDLKGVDLPADADADVQKAKAKATATTKKSFTVQDGTDVARRTGVDRNVAGRSAMDNIQTQGAVSQKGLEGLGELRNNMGAIKGDIAQAGDVDLNVADMRLPGLPEGKHLANVGKVFEGESTWAQGKVITAMKGDIATADAEVTFTKKQITLGQGQGGQAAQKSAGEGGLASTQGGQQANTQNNLASTQGGQAADGNLAQSQGGQSVIHNLPGGKVFVDWAAAGAQHEVPAGLQSRWHSFMTNLKLGGGKDIHAIVQSVIRESYLETSKDLAFYAEKVKFYNGIKKQIRDEVKAMRQLMSSMAGLADDADVPGAPIMPDPIEKEFTGEVPENPGEMTVAQQEALRVAEEAKAHRDKVKGETGKVGDFMDDWNSSEASKTTTDVTGPDNYNPGKGGTATSQAATFGEKLVQWFEGLTESERAAVIAQLQSGGLTMSGDGYENDCWSGNESFNTGDVQFPPMEGNDVEAYLRDCASELGATLQAGCDGIDGTKPYNFNFTISGVGGNDLESTVPPTKEDMEAAGIDTELLEAEGYDFETMSMPSAGSSGEYNEGGPINNKAELQAYLDNLESDLQAVGDDAQLANVDLQNMLQKQQQTMQMMSNISKQLHDTAMAIIRKIAG